MKQLAGTTAVILATLGVLLLVWQFRAVVLLFVLSLFAAAMTRPVIAQLTRWGLPAAAARILFFLALLLILILPFVFFGAQLLDEIQHLADRLALAYEMNFARWQVGSDFEQALTLRLPRPTELYEAMTGNEGELFFTSLFGATQNVLGTLGGLLLVFLLSIYWSSDQAHFERLWLSLLPAGRRIQARNTWRAIEAAIGGYLLSEFSQSILAAFLIGGGLALLGVPYPLLAAVVAAIAWLIPLAGAFVIAALVFALGYSVSLSLAFIALGYAVVVLCFLEFVVEPRFYNRQRYSSLLVIVLMWPMAGIFGLLGLIFAPTLAAAVQLLLRHLIQPSSSNGERVQIAQLESRYDKLHHFFSSRVGDAYPPEIANILNRLSELLQETKTTIREL